MCAHCRHEPAITLPVLRAQPRASSNEVSATGPDAFITRIDVPRDAQTLSLVKQHPHAMDRAWAVGGSAGEMRMRHASAGPNRGLLDLTLRDLSPPLLVVVSLAWCAWWWCRGKPIEDISERPRSPSTRRSRARKRSQHIAPDDMAPEVDADDDAMEGWQSSLGPPRRGWHPADTHGCRGSGSGMDATWMDRPRRWSRDGNSAYSHVPSLPTRPKMLRL